MVGMLETPDFFIEGSKWSCLPDGRSFAFCLYTSGSYLVRGGTLNFPITKEIIVKIKDACICL